MTEDPDGLMSEPERGTFPTAEVMRMRHQVQRFKYVVNVEGHCAALRLKHLLAGPSAVCCDPTTLSAFVAMRLCAFVL